MLALLCLPLLAFVLLRLSQDYYGVNTPLFMWINSSQLGPDWLWQNITFMGDGLPAFVLMVFFARKDARILWVSLIAALLVGLVIHLAKPLFDLLRPAAILGEGQIQILGQTLRQHSFPSGHSATAFVLAGVLVTLLPPYARWPLIMAASLIAWSRVKVGAHWPSDVIIGSIIGWQLARLALYLASLTPELGRSARSQGLLYGLAGICVLALWFHSGGYLLAAPLAQLLSLAGLGFLGFIGYERKVFHKRRL